MTAIAWAIFCAGVYMSPLRDRNGPNFDANNAFDCIMFIIGFGFLIYYSGKSL